MPSLKYRITYTIEQSSDDWKTVEEIGFGSSAAEPSIEEALHFIASDIQNSLWEESS